MAAKLPPAAIAAPNFPLFVISLAAWVTALMVWVSSSIKHDNGWQPRHVYLPLTGVIVALMARWVGASVGLGMLLRRSLAAHALAPILPCLLFVAARSSDPGAGGHGGVFLMIVFGVPFAVAPSMLMGLLGALTSYGVMRAIGGSAGAPRR